MSLPCLEWAWFWVVGQALEAGEGRSSSSLRWRSLGHRPHSPPDSQLGEKPQHYHSIIVTVTNSLSTTCPFSPCHPDLWL